MARAARKKTDILNEEVTVSKGRFKKLEVIKSLVFVFLIIWIFIGLFVSTLLALGFKRGMFDYVLFGKVPQAQQAPNVEAPTETTLPKIGKINIPCAEAALTPESIQKLVGEYDYDITKLAPEEKTEFEKCIVEPPQATPSS